MQIFDFGSACRGVVSKIREREACLATLRTQNSYDGESIFCYFSSFFFKRKTNREENVKSTSEGEEPEQNLTTPQFHHRLLEPAITAGSYDGGLHALARSHLCSQPHAMRGVGVRSKGSERKEKQSGYTALLSCLYSDGVSLYLPVCWVACTRQQRLKASNSSIVCCRAIGQQRN